MKTATITAASLLLVAAQARAAPEPAAPLTRDDARALVAELLADAQARSSLLAADTPAAGYDKNFFLASADNNFRLNFSGFIQWRYLAMLRDDGAAPTGIAGNDNDFEGGFQNRRTRLKFSGHAVNPDLTYTIQGEFSDSTNGGTHFLRDSSVGYKLGSGWALRFGQFKPQLVREEFMDDTKRLAVEGSQASAVFMGGRSQGLEVAYRQDDLRLALLFSDGINAANADFATAAGAPNAAESDYAFTARIDFSPSGKVSDFDEFTSAPGSPWVFNLGGGFHIQSAANTRLSGGAPDTTLLISTADAVLKGDGWSFFAQGMHAHAHRPNIPPPIPAASTDDFGLVVQAGWRFVKADEVFCRYDAIFYDADRGFIDDRQDFITAGLNHYFAGHAAKFTVNALVSLQPTTNAAGATLVPTVFSGANALSTGQGLLRSTASGSVALQAQMLVMF